jgi:hypothetical protein
VEIPFPTKLTSFWQTLAGNLKELENEAAKQLYMTPIPSTLLSLFHGRLLNLPEHTRKGRITTSGRYELSVTLLGMVMILFIEFKDMLKGSASKHSDVIAQILAEADGADLFNQIHESDGTAIHAILTDGQAFEFYVVNFYDWKVMRGVGSTIEAVPWVDGHQICLPSSERALCFEVSNRNNFRYVFDGIYKRFGSAKKLLCTAG